MSATTSPPAGAPINKGETGQTGWSDPWLWALLGLGLGLRLLDIDEPLIDQQAWRQTDTAAHARNYYQEGYTLLYPRVDWRGQTPGFVETNFPFFPFMVACLYGVFGGANEWLGRLLAAVFNVAAGGLLYALARRFYIEPWSARLSVLFYLIFPLNLFFGRAFMPEAAMLFFSIAALLTLDRWFESGTRLDGLWAIASAALCFLIKIPTLYMGFPLVALAWGRWGWGFLRRPALWAYLILSLLPAFIWYEHAYGLFQQTGLTFGIFQTSGYDKWNHVLLLQPDFYWNLIKRFGHSIFTPLGLLLVLWGLGRGIRAAFRDKERVLYIWFAALILYVLLVPEGNRKLHYYQLPFVPVAALFAAKALNGIWYGMRVSLSARMTTGLVVCALVGCGAYSAWAVQDYRRPGNGLYAYYKMCLAVGRTIDAKLPQDALLVVGDWDENAGADNRTQSPSLLYYSARKGWHITPDEFSASTLDSLAGLGANYFLAFGGLAVENKVFWAHLLERGVSMPSVYPRVWHDTGVLKSAVIDYPEEQRQFMLVHLRPLEQITQ